jgi:hypothetical protein
MVKTTEIATVGAGRPKKGSQRQIDNAEFKRLKIIRDEKEKKGGINYYYKAPQKAVENLSVIALPAVSGIITVENPAFVAGISTSSSDAVTTEEIATTAAALPSSSSSPLAAAAAAAVVKTSEMESVESIISQSSSSAAVIESATSTISSSSSSAAVTLTGIETTTADDDNNRVAPASSVAASAVISASSVFSVQMLNDVNEAIRRIKSGNVWPYPDCWYRPPSGPMMNEHKAKDSNHYFAIPVLCFIPVLQFPHRFPNKKCPCPRFGMKHTHVQSNGFTTPCRVVGESYTYAMVGLRYSCEDCKALKDNSTYTFNSYDRRVLAYLPPDIRYIYVHYDAHLYI